MAAVKNQLVLNEEQSLLKTSATDFFQEQSPIDHIRQLRDNADAFGYKPALWQQICEMGWAATIIPEAYGGLGFGFVGLGLVLEAAGRTLAPSPLFSSVGLGANALLLAASETQKQKYLPLIASGEAIFTLALQEGRVHNPRMISCAAVADGEGGYRLSGTKTFVSDGHIASHFLVAARTACEVNDKKGISLFVVDAKQDGIRVKRQVMVDTRNMAEICFDNVALGSDALLGEVGEAYTIIETVLDRANILLSAEMLGSVQAAFEQTLDYLKTREQFGQPIGAFQALQHRAAQMFCEIEVGKSLVLRALQAIDEDGFDVPYMAASAKVHMCDTYRLVSNEGIQMHGGMGVSDEMDIGLFIKRARVVMQWLGDDSYHLQRYARLRGY